jgi:MFS family permease
VDCGLGVSLALGPVLGGVLVAAGGWENIFWFNVAFGLAVLAAAWWFVPESSDPEGRHLDVFGLAFGAAALVAVTFAVIEGENVGYGHWWIPVLFVVSAAAAIAFVAVERRVRDPVLRLDFFRIPTFTARTSSASRRASACSRSSSSARSTCRWSPTSPAGGSRSSSWR